MFTLTKINMYAAVRTMSLAFALTVLGAAAANAQEKPETPPPPPPGPPEVGSRLDHMMTELTQELKLSDEQAEQVREVLAARMQRQQEMFAARRAEDRSSRQEMRESMMKLRTESDAKVKEFLNEEQAAAYEKLMEKRGPRRGRPGMRRRRAM